MGVPSSKPTAPIPAGLRWWIGLQMAIVPTVMFSPIVLRTFPITGIEPPPRMFEFNFFIALIPAHISYAGLVYVIKPCDTRLKLTSFVWLAWIWMQLFLYFLLSFAEFNREKCITYCVVAAVQWGTVILVSRMVEYLFRIVLTHQSCADDIPPRRSLPLTIRSLLNATLVVATIIGAARAIYEFGNPTFVATLVVIGNKIAIYIGVVLVCGIALQLPLLFRRFGYLIWVLALLPFLHAAWTMPERGDPNKTIAAVTFLVSTSLIALGLRWCGYRLVRIPRIPSAPVVSPESKP